MHDQCVASAFDRGGSAIFACFGWLVTPIYSWCVCVCVFICSCSVIYLRIIALFTIDGDTLAWSFLIFLCLCVCFYVLYANLSVRVLYVCQLCRTHRQTWSWAQILIPSSSSLLIGHEYECFVNVSVKVLNGQKKSFEFEFAFKFIAPSNYRHRPRRRRRRLHISQSW